MARFDFNITAFGYSDAYHKMVQRRDNTSKIAREHAREAGRTMITALRRTAPRKTGKFAAGLFYRTYEREGGYEIRFYAGGEHGYVLPFLLYGTADHIIPKGGSAAQMAKGYPLRFFWAKGPKGPGTYRYWSVHHPGTNPSPFVGQARTEAAPLIREELRQIVKLAWL